MFKQTFSLKARVLSAWQHGALKSQSDAQAEHRDRTNQAIGGRNLWLLLLVCGVSAVLWVVVASRSGLWADEVFSLAMATGHSLEHPAAIANPALGDFVEADHAVQAEDFRRYLKHEDPPAGPARVVRAVFLSDTNPPLYYLLLYGWTLIFGTSDIALRSFSIACSLACLPLLVGIARWIGGKGAVFACCILFASSPLSIYYSTEGRMYSLLWLCVLATTWASLAVHEREGGIPIYALWVVASAAGFLTHYFFVFPWLAIVVYLFISTGKLQRMRLAACLLLVAMLILPWYVRLPESLAAWRITKDWLTWQPKGFNRLIASRGIVVQFFSGRSDLWWHHPVSDSAATILFGIVAVLMAWRLRSRVFGQHRLLLWLLFAAPCAGLLVFDLIQHTYTMDNPRYAIAALPAAYLLAAIGFTTLDSRLRLVMLALVVCSWAPDVLSVYRNTARSWSPLREISRAASVNSAPTDLILVHSIPSGVLGISRYASGPAALGSWVGQLGTRHVPESLHAMIAGRTRIAFVKVHEVQEPAPEEKWLRANAVVVRQRRLFSGTITDFRPINSGAYW